MYDHALEDFEEEEVESLIAMLEARAQRPACRGLEKLEAANLTGSGIPEAPRTRLLRTLLPSVKELDDFEWDNACETSFVEIPPPRLKKLSVCGTLIPSVAALEAMPALEKMWYGERGVASRAAAEAGGHTGRQR